jgi:hypothetical protein
VICALYLRCQGDQIDVVAVEGICRLETNGNTENKTNFQFGNILEYGYVVGKII